MKVSFQLQTHRGTEKKSSLSFVWFLAHIPSFPCFILVEYDSSRYNTLFFYSIHFLICHTNKFINNSVVQIARKSNVAYQILVNALEERLRFEKYSSRLIFSNVRQLKKDREIGRAHV